MNTFFLLLSSIICAAGTAIVLETKRYEWPVRNVSILLRRFLQKHVHRKMHRMPKCSVCLAFWTAILSDIGMFVLSGGHYWLWPLSGFATAGVVYLLYEFMAVLDQIGASLKRPSESSPDTSPPKATYNPASLGQLMEAAKDEPDNESESSEWDEAAWDAYHLGETSGKRDMLREIARIPPGKDVDLEADATRVKEHLANTKFYALEMLRWGGKASNLELPSVLPDINWDEEVERLRQEQQQSQQDHKGL